MNQNKVSDYFKLPSLRLSSLKKDLDSVDKKYNIPSKIKSKPYLFGIEVEVENITQEVPPLHYWTATTDGSLRNHGLEFVSKPIRTDQVENALKELNDALPPNRDFSERTSTHVHMNVRDLTMSEIYNVTMLYYIVERILFKWIGHEREENVFCLPLYETDYYNQIQFIQNNPNKLEKNWTKYSAFNLKCLSSKGTIEFRHMYGTSDADVLTKWISLLCCLKQQAKEQPSAAIEQQITDLNTTSDYDLFLRQLFGEHAELFQGYDLQHLMEESVTHVKMGIVLNKKYTDVATQTNVDQIRPLNHFFGTPQDRGDMHRRNLFDAIQPVGFNNQDAIDTAIQQLEQQGHTITGIEQIGTGTTNITWRTA